MFSLILVIISIALVAALTVAVIYYGGDAFSEGRATADAARLINSGQQIAGAVQMYRSDHGSAPAELTLLTSNNGQYLNALPEGNWIAGASSVLASVSEAKCKELNRRLGFKLETIPSCSDPQYTTMSVCCAD